MLVIWIVLYTDNLISVYFITSPWSLMGMAGFEGIMRWTQAMGDKGGCGNGRDKSGPGEIGL